MNTEKIIAECELYLDHNPVWAGDGYFCSNCMLQFAPLTTLRAETIEEAKGCVGEDESIKEVVSLDGENLLIHNDNMLAGIMIGQKIERQRMRKALSNL